MSGRVLVAVCARDSHIGRLNLVTFYCKSGVGERHQLLRGFRDGIFAVAYLFLLAWISVWYLPQSPRGFFSD